MRTIFIGDIHGCLDELRELLDVVAPAAGDRLMFVGDYVDRGPDSPGVLALVRSLLGTHPGSVAVAGNHESKLMQDEARAVTKRSWQPDIDEATWAFLRSLPLLHVLPDLAAVVVHGGLFPRFFEHYPDGLDRVRPDWHHGGGRYMDRARRFLRVRWVNPTGDMVGLGKETTGDRHWSAAYDGRAGFAIFGHDPLLEGPRRAEHALGLDKGCVFGGALTAYVVEDDVRDGTFVSVPARKVHATSMIKPRIRNPD